jgi:PhnB protein
MKVQPYLFFNGRCEEAAKFYCNNLGAETTEMMRFSDMPEGEDNSTDVARERRQNHAHGPAHR